MTPTSSPTSSRGRRENVGVSFSLPQEQLQEIARVGRVGEDPREDVGVGVVECHLIYVNMVVM